MGVLVQGNGHGASVALPSFTCRAAVDSILAAGREPRFVDIREELNLDPVDVECRLRDDVAAVIVPHMFGRPADIEAIETLCRPKGILVIDDAAAAMGIKHGGRYLGTFGDAGVFSFAQQKSLVAGQGGLLLANSERMQKALEGLELAEPNQWRAFAEALWWQWEYRYRHRLSWLRYYLVRVKRMLFGMPRKRPIRMEKMPRVYEAIARVQIQRMDEILGRRAQNCKALYERLKDTPGLLIPQYYEGCMLTRFFVRTPGLRWEYNENGVEKPHPLAAHLGRLGIETGRPYYPLHLHREFRQYADRPLPRTEEIAPELVALPVQGKMGEWEYDAIAEGVRSFFSARVEAHETEA
ncbi:MAG TPA: DegT/DnrJ/EryC1/StrS family aminotransferase [Phycisphaerae bacterium]|nr:DegT/DnrJ/EryC1/StrS family aminotransferase [Phycisphaerae bacterium]